MSMIINGKEVPEISQSTLYEVLCDEDNTLIFGNMGTGKTTIVKKYAKDKGKTLLIFSLATMIPEFIGGVPYAQVSADKKTEYFNLLLNEVLRPMLECEGKDYVLFFDEINQAPTEVMNCLYSICHIDPEQREWCGHSLKHAQIVAAGNLSDGTDGTVYLNDLPGPLLDRFDVFLLVSSKADSKEYLKEKWSNIPLVEEYIDAMQEADINPRRIEHCLDLLAYKKSLARLQSATGSLAVTQKLMDIQKKVAILDNPTKLLNNARAIYAKFKAKGSVTNNGHVITTEEELIKAFKKVLNDEEIASIMKGDE